MVLDITYITKDSFAAFDNWQHDAASVFKKVKGGWMEPWTPICLGACPHQQVPGHGRFFLALGKGDPGSH